jgi:DNA-binding transcriptional MerR regulator
LKTVETFGKEDVISLTGLTYRQIDYWAATGVVIPFKPGMGKGSRREYSFTDIVALRVAKKLKEDGITLQKIRKALAWLSKQEDFKDLTQPLGKLKFVTNGENLFVVDRDLDRDKEKIIDALSKGQYVFSVTLGSIIEDLKGEVRNFTKARRKTKVLIGSRSFTIILTYDPEGTEFMVWCEELPSFTSKGKTEQEALHNIIDVLERYEHEREEPKAM